MPDASPFKSRIYVRKQKTALSTEQRAGVLLWQPDPSLVRETRVLPSGMRVRFLRVSKSQLAGRTILFFSDTHIRTAGVRGFFPGVRQGGGTEWLAKSFRELFEAIPMPDCIAFGGDLAGDAAWIGKSLDFLRTIPSGPEKFAVCGNWELRRRWLPAERWRELFAEAGFRLLMNETSEAHGILFHGLDDAKEGDGLSGEAAIPRSENVCVLSHNPDTASAMLLTDRLKGAPLILCGHTHGGQFRIPGFGAVMTSSRFGKRLEYGAYRHSSTGATMYVTAGIGTTWFHARICCPPEVLFVNFC
ncbi:MAG: metallophosphoesterase [Lentisphaeria bacterium]|nr:metallophosphoesterase [Lentisphaeria bacterium]